MWEVWGRWNIKFFLNSYFRTQMSPSCPPSPSPPLPPTTMLSTRGPRTGWSGTASVLDPDFPWSLKGTVPRDFRFFRFFSWISFPKPPSIPEYISPQIFEKNRNALIIFSGAWGKMVHEKNLTEKISWYCPFNSPRDPDHQISLPNESVSFRRQNFGSRAAIAPKKS